MTAGYVLRRELKALVRLPQTYAIAAAYLILSGIFFVNILISTEIPDLAQYYTNIATTLLVLVPIVAMRSFAEDRRSGGLDITLTWPSSRPGLVLGKFAANTAFVWFLTSVVWIYFWLVADLASIQGGRTAGGFIGLLLMAAAFSALALVVSARASSPTAAAFLGFGLLLFLWILDYAPGWIGDQLRSLGPAEHFESFPRGVMYAEDIAYFVIVTVVGLSLATAALNRARPGPAFGSLIRRTVTVGLVAVIWAGGSAVANDLDTKVDLTPTKQNTLTAVTKGVLDDVDGRVRLTGFAEPLSTEAVQLRDLVRQYEAAGARVDLEIVDPDAQPGKARAAGITLYGQVRVAVGDRSEVIDDPSQIALTSALHRLSGVASPRACFTVGHGERDIGDKARNGVATLAGLLRKLYYEVTPVALAVGDAERALGACSVVIVAGARVPFLADEFALLDEYVRRDGRLLVLADPAGPRDQLNDLLAPWGVALGAGIVSDLSSLAGDPPSVVTDDYPSKSPATLLLNDQDLPVVFTSSVPIEGTAASGYTDEDEDQVHFSPLARSSHKSWVDPVAGSGGKRLNGPFALAGVADRSRVQGKGERATIGRTRVGVVGSVDMAGNRGIEILGNREFVGALVQWVAKQDDLIASGRPPGGFYKLVLTEAQKNRLIRQGIVLPAALMLLLIPAPLLRLRRG